MSTRATYEFVDGEIKTYVYVHYDNYPQGAASYFYETLINPSKGNFATQFIRAIKGAEITQSHEYHGDTDYQYVITGIGPKAHLNCICVQSKASIFEGYLNEFINQNKEVIENYHPFKEVVNAYGFKRVFNLDTAKKFLEYEFGPLGNLKCWKGKHEGSSNWKSCVNEVRLLIEVFPELNNDEIKTLI